MGRGIHIGRVWTREWGQTKWTRNGSTTGEFRRIRYFAETSMTRSLSHLSPIALLSLRVPIYCNRDSRLSASLISIPRTWLIST
jgi:hypothetical protein